MRKEMPLVSFSVESDRQKHAKSVGKHTFFYGFPTYLWCCQALL